MPFGHDATYEDLITNLMSISLPYLILLAFLPPVYNTVFHIVREKESRIKETMLIMGMKRFSYWLSWYVSYTIVSTLIALLAWSMLLINVINHSNEFLVLLMILCYAQSIFGLIVFLSAIFESSKQAGIIGSLIYFGLNLFSLILTGGSITFGTRMVFSIFPQIAMDMTCYTFVKWETSGVGV